MLTMKPSHPPRPSICRNFVFTGICKEAHCPRAHVPHRDMIDLLAYLSSRLDCPSELRSARGFQKPPSFTSRRPLPSDRICRNFFPHPCLWKGCTRTHFSVGRIYCSLLRAADRAQPREPAMPTIGSEAFLETTVDLTTHPTVSMPANNEQPEVKRPQGAGPAEPIPFDDDPPFVVVVRLPTVSSPDRETTPTESIDFQKRSN